MLVLSFARIHMANLINNGILPLTFINPDDYDAIDWMDDLVIDNAPEQIRGLAAGKNMTVLNQTKGRTIEVSLPLSERQAKILLAGGLLNFTRKEG